MIDIGEGTWIDPDSVESVREGHVIYPEAADRLIVTMKSGAQWYLPEGWTVYDLFNRMYPE